MEEFQIPPDCSMNQFCDILSDPNCLRWDVMGLYFVAVGLSACYVNDGAPRAQIEQRRNLAKRMLEVSTLGVQSPSFFTRSMQISSTIFH